MHLCSSLAEKQAYSSVYLKPNGVGFHCMHAIIRPVVYSSLPALLQCSKLTCTTVMPSAVQFPASSVKQYSFKAFLAFSRSPCKSAIATIPPGGAQSHCPGRLCTVGSLVLPRDTAIAATATTNICESLRTVIILSCWLLCVGA